MQTKERKKLSKARRINAKLYPIYKMFSWDLLFFYSIEFLFYTITKGLTASEILTINGLYIIFKTLMNIPAIAICDRIGKRNGIIVGNILVLLNIVILIVMPGAISVILANLISSLGWMMKAISESNLVYDSVATRGGDGLYTKLDAKGGSLYYLLDGIASLTAGYLFVINNYLPIYICLTFVLTATVISLFFKEIYPPKKEERKALGTFIKEYKEDLKISMKFIVKSRRMKSYILFGAIFYGIIVIFDTYKGNLLTDMGVPEEQYSMIIAVLSFIAGLSVNLIPSLEKKFKNRVLTLISLVYIVSFVIVGSFVTNFSGKILLPIILAMYCLARMADSIWYILEYKYLKNFSTPEMRGKITFAYEFIKGIVASMMSILGGLVLKIIDIKDAFLVVSLASLAILILILDYMRTRFGLKPEQYSKEDIEFVDKVEEKVTNE